MTTGFSPGWTTTSSSNPFDRQRMREGVHITLELSEHPWYRELLAERVDPDEADLESDDSLDTWMRTRVSTSHHVSGTCKMGPASDGMAVVDQYGRVHGLEGLRVVDASIMPDCIRANTNATDPCHRRARRRFHAGGDVA